MSEEKKPGSTGPVVIRKGHVMAPPAAAPHAARAARPRRDREDPRGGAPERGPRLPPGEPPPAPEVHAPDEGSFADLLAASATAPRSRHKVGDNVAGEIIQLNHDVAFLELGSGHAEAMIDVAELR